MALKSTAVLGPDVYPRVSPFRLPRVKPIARLSLKPVRFGETMRADSGPAVDEKDGGADLPKSLQKHFNFFPRPLSVADLSAGPNDGKQLRISFKGLRGSYSEEAALKAYPKCETVPCEEFEDAFKAVELWIVDKAILPIESSSGGSIHRNYDLLLRHRLHIVGEVQLPVNFCLLALPGVKAEQLKRVMSHPQALDCSEIFLSKLGVARENVDDTAAAAQFIASNGLRDVGAVASARTSEIYGLSILAEKIQDDPDDITRFLVLARDPLMPRKNKLYKTHCAMYSHDPPLKAQEAELVLCKLQLDELSLRGLVGENSISEVASGMGLFISVEDPPAHNLKTSVVFTLDEGPGMLFKALAVFALREISLTKIESRPQRNRPLRVVDDSNTGTAKYFDYLFYIDFEASMAEPRAQNALAHLQEFAAFLRVLGCYPMDTSTL